MSFIEIQFPADISYGSHGGPQYSTDVVENFAGYEQRNSNWSEGRAKYNVAHGVKTPEQLEELIAFFRARKGKAYGFRFKDWTDYQGINQLLGVGDGERVSFPLLKHYSSGGITEVRTITKPVDGTVALYLDSILQTSGYTVNYSTGIVTFTSAPASGINITADFEFDVPVRFDTDELDASIDDFGTRSWTDIPLVEVRL